MRTGNCTISRSLNWNWNSASGISPAIQLKEGIAYKSASFTLSSRKGRVTRRLTMSANIINVPDRALSWRWLDESEENRLTFFPDSKKPNAGTFVLSKEDHTLGNLIRLQLLRDTSVRFAGYRMPHPLIFDCHVRVETMDSKLTPMNVFDAALSDLQLETEALSTKWEVCCVSIGAFFRVGY